MLPIELHFKQREKEKRRINSFYFKERKGVLKQGDRFVNISIDNKKCFKVVMMYNDCNPLFSFLAPNTPASNSLLTPTLPESSNSVVKSTNFTGSIPTSRAEIRHKSEIEIEVKHEKPRQTKNNNNNNNNTSPSSTSSYPQVIRPTPSNKRTPTILFDEQPLSQQYQPITKRRVLTNSIQTQTPPLQFNSHDHHVQQQQQLKALTDESLSKNEKIQAILRELNDCQVRLSKE